VLAKYGQKGRRVKEGGRTSSSWLKDVVDIRKCNGLEVGSWFEDSLARVVGGGGTKTIFWSDLWLEGELL